ncbi:protein kinase domain-containing protein [Spongorhabdus nitratireducens]
MNLLTNHGLLPSCFQADEDSYPAALEKHFYLQKYCGSQFSRYVVDRKTGQPFLLKGVFSSDQQQYQTYILNEARALLELKGIQGIPRLEGLIRSEGGLWLLVQWLPEAQSVLQCGRGRRAAGKLVQQLAPLLAACHGRGICHCDLHPDNLVYSNGQLWLLDFGAALRADIPYPYRRQLSYGFASPDLLRGQGKVSFADDHFSLLILLWVLWTGRHPFGGRIPANMSAALAELKCPDNMSRSDFRWFIAHFRSPQNVSLGNIYMQARRWY